MTPHPRCRLALLLAVIVPTLMTPRAGQAQMTPLADLREIRARAEYQGVINGPLVLQPSAPFAAFNDFVDAYAPGDLEGDATADATQNSSWASNSIFASGSSVGQWQTVGPGRYDALSQASFVFRVDAPATYTLSAQVEPGDPGSNGAVELSPYGSTSYYFQHTAGILNTAGRLAPGTYTLSGYSKVGSTDPAMTGPTYAILWTIVPAGSSLISGQLRDTVITCGPPLTLTVLPTNATGNTFQWRRNFVPLANSAHLAGVTTASLTISNACVADTGFYDVVLTNVGLGIIEPSHAAHVTTVPTGGVEPSHAPGAAAFALAAPRPNPASGPMSFRFTARSPVVARATIYDAAGRRVFPLGNRTVSGSGAFDWDGRDASGALVPSGIYYLRVNTGGESHVQRFVRMR